MTTKHILSSSIALLTLALPAFAASAPKKTETKPADDKSALTFANGMLTLDLEERLRWEVRDNTRDFNRATNDVRDDGWVLNRFRLGIAFRPSPWVKIYAQTQDTREWFGQRGNVPGVNGVEGGDYFDLRQAYIELGNLKEFPLSLTVGRQALDYGDNRLVADSKWGNFGRTFDGVKLRLQTDKFWVDTFAVRPVQIRKNSVNDSDSADNFFGIYAGSDFLGFQTTELYFLYRDKADNQPDLDPTNKLNPDGTYTGPAQRIVTLGTRWKSKAGALHGWDYTAEFAYQFGQLWTGDRTTKRLNHHAFAAAIKGGYTWENAPWTPRLGIEYDYA
ncbi:MAG: alginate export family protein, partial [Betaproteobacteria bacterium]